MSDARDQVTRLLAIVNGEARSAADGAPPRAAADDPVQSAADGGAHDARSSATSSSSTAGSDSSPPTPLDPAAAREQLLMLVYDELRQLAQRRMNTERAGHTLQATALVHEAWMRLAGTERMEWTSRRHFFGAAAEAMRRVLVDHARKVRSAKRGGDAARLSLSLADVEVDEQPERLLALNEALDTLEAEDERAAEVARLRWFAGLEVKEVAAALDCSERTVMREWAFAKARLSELLGDEGAADPRDADTPRGADPRSANDPRSPDPRGANDPRDGRDPGGHPGHGPQSAPDQGA